MMRSSNSEEERPILECQNLQKEFSMNDNVVTSLLDLDQSVKAVGGVSFKLHEGETLGLIGESGCGKTTVGRCIVGLTSPSEGEVKFKGRDITGFKRRQLSDKIQMCFQNPASSLNERKKIGNIIGGPLVYNNISKGKPKQKRVYELMEQVGLPKSYYHQYPSELSGGQKQRVDIARAISVNPDLIILDEPVSALDVSIQAQILNLLMDLQEDFGFSYLFISHDLSVVKHISDRICVMYLGEIVEKADTSELFADPKHPYTNMLLDAIPNFDPSEPRARIESYGELPDPINPPSGCSFHPRCDKFIKPAHIQASDEDWEKLYQFRRILSSDFVLTTKHFDESFDIKNKIKDPDAFVEDCFPSIDQETEAELIRACRAVNSGNNKKAERIMLSLTKSPCETTKPELISTNDHEVRCHLFDSDIMEMN